MELVSKKEFIKIFSPVLGWFANNKNVFFDSINFNMKNDIEGDYLYLDLCFFLNGKPEHWVHSNTFIIVYQERSRDKLLEIKSLIKGVLKVKSVNEFEDIKRLIEF